MDRILLGFRLQQPLPEQGLKNLRRYKYSSVDNSLLSKYVLCHYWNALVNLFPLWMAPNLITLIGLLTIIASAVLSIAHAPTLTGVLPSWLYYTIGASVWIYASLDAIDGKQARRTGQSGPLGELFDHGCDALNLSLMNFILPMIFGISIDWYFMATVFAFLFGFYVVTWDEYHTHTLYLTVISGPVEGTIIFTIASFLSGYYGQNIWSLPLNRLFPFLTGTVLEQLALKTLIPFGLIGAGIATILNSIFRVNKKNRGAMMQLYPFISFSAAVAVCLLLNSVLWDHIVEVLLYIGFAFGHATATMILAHLTLSVPSLYEPSYVPAVAGAILCIVKQSGFVDFSAEQSRIFLRVSVIYTCTTYLLRAIVTIRQITSFLDIYCLAIKKKEQQKLA